ncbi:ribokinase [Desulfosporosinus orientis DSM 765]|uniref:Ribokinase n=1 Tax=Desulfosporosinus orientis (strain ATCC 19365 / DSM 765 / NCIMB 8382 / VKM B-1628 / Singapore I) TaxID=768706 RepID=G7WCG4_DESOD|nr:ribokinase [Desulfosporosinus orientis]AET66286.1 ribokinase [Desulfosporosinus orientis DSM 765]
MNQPPKVVVIGSLNMDLVVKARRAPKRGETVMGDEIHFIPGGKGANQAVGLARLGAEISMIGAVGSDSFGRELKRALKKTGVNITGVKEHDSQATGVASILLAEGDNSIVVVPGANALCLPEDLEDNERMIAEADLVLLQLEIPLATVEYGIQLAKKHGKIVMLNPAPAQSLSQELLSQVDYLTPNRSELALLAGMPEESSVAQGINRLLDTGVTCCVTTLGAEGAAFMEKEGSITKILGHQVPVVDTTGAGDAFNAGLAYALAQQKSIREAAEFAVEVSALAVTKFGAQGGMPRLREVEEHFTLGQYSERGDI